MAANWAASNGASQLMKTTSMSRCQTPNSTPWGQQLPARKVLGPIQASRYSSIAKRAEDFGPLNSKPGEEVWRTPHPGCGDVPGCSPAQSAAVTAIPGLVFSGGLDGRLRAYFAENGKIAWDMDTKGDYQAVNGVAAKGGSIDGGGAVVVDGMVYVGSGSGFVGTAPGNVLLAYSIDGL